MDGKLLVKKKPNEIIQANRCLRRSCGYVFVASAIYAHQDTRIQPALIVQPRPNLYKCRAVIAYVVCSTQNLQPPRNMVMICVRFVFFIPPIVVCVCGTSVCHSVGVLDLFTVVQHSTSHTYVTCINTGIVLNFHIILVFTFTRFTSFSLCCAQPVHFFCHRLESVVIKIKSFVFFLLWS